MAVWVCVFAGCAGGPKAGLPPGMVGVETPADLAPLVTRMDSQGERNWVLNLNELGVAAMRRGDRDLARRAFDESILYINAVFGSTPEAVRARSLFFNEDVKLFKGDPYERSMTFFYRGVLYMQDRDWENARACFRSGVLQDAFAEEEQNRADWVIFDYLIAVCEVQLGGELYAEEAFDRAREVYESFPARYRGVAGGQLPLDPSRFTMPSREDNLLVITQSGSAPQKIAVGEYGAYLGFSRGFGRTGEVRVGVCDQQEVSALALDSVFYQATTRGGRPFDRIQGRKVFFKGTSEAIATASAASGYLILASSRNDQQAIAGGALMATGLMFAAFSELVSAKADTRQWTSLPDSVGVLTSRGCSGMQPIRVRFPDGTMASADVAIPEPGRGLAVVLAMPGTAPSLLVSN